MLQQIIALIFIAFFIWRLLIQKKRKQVGSNEFVFWLSFWIVGALAIIFIRALDRLLSAIGFSGSGINFLLYLAVITLFYFVFKLRLKLSKLETSLTELVRTVTLK
ncbi:MAG: DUF2304 family protein [Bacillota bacterium]